MDNQRVLYLHQQYLKDEFSEAELMEWNALLQDPGSIAVLTTLMDGNWNQLPPKNGLVLNAEKSAVLLKYITSQAQNKAPGLKLWPVPAVAAVIALVLFGAGLLYFNHQHAELERKAAFAKILPGKNRATLTLANGKTITLSEEKTGLVINASQLTYNDGSKLANQPVQTGSGQQELILHTPRSGTYQLVLPDSTKVWLNASSSIVFPASFKTLERKVRLDGEAYFEVYKDKAHPFLVQTSLQRVEVLGTHFNINAYQDEQFTKTTLFEGSVRVFGPDDAASSLLRPGQAAINKGKAIQVGSADLEEAIAWKNGYFKFNSETIVSVMRKLSRWYDIEVVYDGKVTNDRFSGTVGRNQNISEVLKILESTKLLKFKMEGRKIIVK